MGRRRLHLPPVVSSSTRLQDQVSAFLEHCEIDRNLSPLTVRMYAQYLGSFGAWAAAEGVSSAEQVTPEVARRYRVHLNRYVSPVTRRNLSRGTQTSYLVALRSLLRFLSRSGEDTMAADRVELGKSGGRSLQVLHPPQAARLLASGDAGHDPGVRSP